MSKAQAYPLFLLLLAQPPGGISLSHVSSFSTISFLCLQVDTHLYVEVVSRMLPKTLRFTFYAFFWL